MHSARRPTEIEPWPEPDAHVTPSAAEEILVGGAALVADPAGVLYWPEQQALVVADLHLEKGSGLASRGLLLPPYDTAASLGRLSGLVTRYAPRLVIALGDSFHDGDGARRMAPQHRDALRVLQRARDWLWIAGNHDPDPDAAIGGRCAAMLALGGLTFRHEPKPQEDTAVAGHLHPVARLHVRGQGIRRRCFVSDHGRIVMPAFGSYAGGLNVRHAAFAGLFSARFTAHILGEHRLYAVAGHRCLAD